MDAARRTANVVFAVTQVLVPLLPLFTALPQMGTVSNRYPTWVVPAGWAFSIWTPIFAAALIYAIWQALPSQAADPLLRRVGWLTAAAFFGNTLWQIVFPLGLFAASVVVIVGILVALIGVVGGAQRHELPLTAPQRWLVWILFGVHLGWITLATVANVSLALLAAGWEGGAGWGIAVLLVVGAIAAWVTRALDGNAGYALAVLWGLAGVVAGRLTGDPLASTAVAVAAGVAAVVVLGSWIASLQGRRHATVL